VNGARSAPARRAALLVALLALGACDRDLADDECKLLTLGSDFEPICDRVGPDRYREWVTSCTVPQGDIERFAACLKERAASEQP